ncbi:MAG: hypothetical protein KF845_11055 [Cyclobacteriaceae bacterium]|nr:hypothetical protein [Cyclobacteriaceae bacterium]
MKLMKYYTVGLILLSLVLITCDTKNNVEPTFKDYFIKYYGEDGNHEAKDFVVTNNQEIIIVGTVTLGLNKRVYVVKADQEGTELWSVTLDSDSNELAEDIEPILEGAHAGNYVILSNAQTAEDVLETRFTIITATGVVESRHTLPSRLASQEGLSITPIQTGGSGGFYLAGRTTDWDAASASNSLPTPPDIIEDLLVIKLDQDFDTISFDRIGGSHTGSAIKVIQLNNNRFMYAGHWDGKTDGRLPDEPKIESNIFFRTFENDPSGVPSLYSGTLSLHERLVSVCRSSFGIEAAIATQSDDNGINRKVFAVTTSSNFSTVLSERVLLGQSGEYEAVSVSAGANRFLVLANEINAQGNRDIYLKRVDGFLEADLDLKFGSVNNDDRGAAIAELPNGDILILGTMELAGQQDKIALIKVRPNGAF